MAIAKAAYRPSSPSLIKSFNLLGNFPILAHSLKRVSSISCETRVTVENKFHRTLNFLYSRNSFYKMVQLLPPQLNFLLFLQVPFCCCARKKISLWWSRPWRNLKNFSFLLRKLFSRTIKGSNLWCNKLILKALSSFVPSGMLEMQKFVMEANS